MTTSGERYVDLLLECVNGSVHGTPQQLVPLRPSSPWKARITSMLERRGRPLTRLEEVSESALHRGVDWPAQRWNPGESMIGRTRLRQLRGAIDTVVAEDIPGDVIETGVWRGGACILAKGTLEAHGDTTRKVFVADSFRGLPPADASDDAAVLHLDSTLAIPRSEVQAAFERYGLLDDRVIFVEGWFRDTLPGLQDERWSIVRLDGDMYESTMDGLVNLVPQVSAGGFVIIDDYFAYQSCRRAVDEFRADNQITAELIDIDGTGAYWRV